MRFHTRPDAPETKARQKPFDSQAFCNAALLDAPVSAKLQQLKHPCTPAGVAYVLATAAYTPSVGWTTPSHSSAHLSSQALQQLAKLRDPAFTTEDANRLTFELHASAEIEPRGGSGPGMLLEFPADTSERAKVDKIIEWARACRSTSSRELWPTQAAYQAFKSFLRTRDAAHEDIPAALARRFLYLVEVARRAPQVTPQELQLLASCLDRVDLAQVPEQRAAFKAAHASLSQLARGRIEQRTSEALNGLLTFFGAKLKQSQQAG